MRIGGTAGDGIDRQRITVVRVGDVEIDDRHAGLNIAAA